MMDDMVYILSFDTWKILLGKLLLNIFLLLILKVHYNLNNHYILDHYMFYIFNHKVCNYYSYPYILLMNMLILHISHFLIFYHQYNQYSLLGMNHYILNNLDHNLYNIKYCSKICIKIIHLDIIKCFLVYICHFSISY